MKINSILYATDFSPTSEEARRYASSLAADHGAKLYIVYVDLDSVSYAAMDETYSYLIDESAVIAESERKQQELHEIHPTVRGLECEHVYLRGDPAHQILKYAKDEKIELIVLGSHGRTGWSRMLMGSVAESIVRGAECPVIVVKHPKVEEEHAA